MMRAGLWTIKGDCTATISHSLVCPKVENVYALKSIQLDRVKPLFVEELKNEIAILKVCRDTPYQDRRIFIWDRHRQLTLCLFYF